MANLTRRVPVAGYLTHRPAQAALSLPHTVKVKAIPGTGGPPGFLRGLIEPSNVAGHAAGRSNSQYQSALASLGLFWSLAPLLLAPAAEEQ